MKPRPVKDAPNWVIKSANIWISARQGRLDFTISWRDRSNLAQGRITSLSFPPGATSQRRPGGGARPFPSWPANAPTRSCSRCRVPETRDPGSRSRAGFAPMSASPHCAPPADGARGVGMTQRAHTHRPAGRATPPQRVASARSLAEPGIPSVVGATPPPSCMPARADGYGNALSSMTGPRRAQWKALDDQGLRQPYMADRVIDHAQQRFGAMAAAECRLSWLLRKVAPCGSTRVLGGPRM